RAVGDAERMSLDSARKKARIWLDLIEQGRDPKEEERRAQEQERRSRRTTFAAVAEDFIEQKLASERKGREVERDIRRDLITALGDKPITEVTPQDVRFVVIAVKKRGPYQAHNTLGHAKRLFNWAI